MSSGARAPVPPTADIVQVALDLPLPTLFDYRLPGAGASLAGRRVIVPFGRGRKVGIILGAGAPPGVAPDRIRDVLQVMEDEPALPAALLDLLRFAAQYYHHALGPVVLGAMPTALRAVGQRQVESTPGLRITELGRTRSVEGFAPRAASRRRLLSLLQERGSVAASEFAGLAAAAAAMVREGLAERIRVPRVAAPVPHSHWEPAPGPRLTPDQQAAADAVASEAGSFSAFLLLGVTGSGKTEVYFDLVARVVAAGRSALILVPEINLTPQLETRFRRRFPGMPLASLHSSLPDGERLAAWRSAQRGEARVVIGTRLAVFTPLPDLGLIVVDEEHDSSFKQQEGLRYSARDLAIWRARREAVPVVLGSATPSLESYSNALAGRYRLLELGSRPGSALPSVRRVDTRAARPVEGLSPPLLQALRQCLERGEQSLVFVNRRGFSPALLCSACGWAAPCPRCSARLVLHLRQGRLRCHYCGHEQAVTVSCPDCGNQDLRPAGQGTQRLESALEQMLPEARVLRIDRDSTRSRHAFVDLQRRMQGDEVDILVGTQMLAKGHDFARLTLVGVVNTDGALFSADFRASERLFALLTQVAGRAGRGARPGQVLIQTEFPDHALYAAVCRQDYRAFADGELAQRKEAELPPFTQQALLRAEAAQRDSLELILRQAAQAGVALGRAVEIFDPVPPPVARVAGRERAHLLVQAATRAELAAFLVRWMPLVASIAGRQVRWALDVDPIDV